MKVFAVFSEDTVELVRLWSDSWRSRGWHPRLISEKEIEEAGSVRKAVKLRGGGILVDVMVINFDYPVRNCPRLRAVRHGKPGWDEAPLVRFSKGTTEQAIRDCGRSL